MKALKWRGLFEMSTLDFGQIHIWSVHLNEDSNMSVWFRLLSEDERARAKRLISPLLRRRFTCARAALRLILAEYLDLSPTSIKFGYYNLGKPFIFLEKSSLPLEFSISHTKDQLLMAFSRSSRLGIDLEHIRPVDGTDQIIRSFFSEQDWETYRSLNEEEGVRAFLTAWTRKEALGKVHGNGLSLPFQKDFFFSGDDQIIPINGYQVLNRNNYFWLHFWPQPHFIATAVYQSDTPLNCFFWKTTLANLSDHLIREEMDSSTGVPSWFLRV